MPTCVECGDIFSITSRVGKPRKRCYTCSPARPNQKLKRVKVISAVPPNSKHCPWCGAYPNPGSAVYPFCNPSHRSFFAEKVAAAQEKLRIRQAKGPTR